MFSKAYQAWLHGDSFQQAGNMFGVEYYLQTISQMFHAHQNTLHDKKVSITNRPNFWTESLASRSFSHHGTIHTSEFDNMKCVECRRPLRQGVGSQRYWLAHLDFPAHTIPPEWNDLCAHCDGQCETKVVILHMFARALKMHTWLHDVPSLVWGLKKIRVPFVYPRSCVYHVYCFRRA